MDAVVHYGDVFNRDDFEERPYCGACSGNVRTKVTTLHRGMGIDSLRCENCGLVSASHHLKPAAISRLYANYPSYMKQRKWQDGVTFDGPDRLAEVIAKSVNINAERAELLDYGGGNGIISYLTAKQLLAGGRIKKAEVTVLDYSDNLIENDDSRIVLQHKSVEGRAEDRNIEPQYDLIIASAVLEHITDNGSLLKLLFSSVKKGGFIYIRVPRMIGLFKIMRLLSEARALQFIEFPQHVHDYGEEFFMRIPALLGFDGVTLKISRPSTLENTFDRHFVRALLSRAIRAPYYLFPGYPLVGGWEVVYSA